MIKEVFRGQTIRESLDFILETCCNCSIPYFIPAYHQKRLIAAPGETFYCPNGHPQHYTGKSEAQKLREELAKLKEDRHREGEELQNRWLDAVNEKNRLQNQLKRVHNGVCPCCNRTFSNLARHMKTKHPEVVPPPTQKKRGRPRKDSTPA